jgi:hypothetical protein
MKDKYVDNLTVNNRKLAFGRFNYYFQEWVRRNWDTDISELLTINMTSLNTLSTAEEFVLEISDSSIPPGKYVSEIFVKVTDEPESYSYGYTGCKVLSIELLNLYNLTAIGSYPKDSNTAVKLTLDSANPQDWTGGVIKVYGKLSSIPNF